jgi:hypothetical protein
MSFGKLKWPVLATLFADFIRSAEGQAVIRDFGKDKFGAPLFSPMS